jgi:4-amino-4-deoxychorismate lyase
LILVPAILINGQKTEPLSVLDRGFQYGDGLFETLRITAGKPRRWSRHMARLADGCEKLGISMPEPALLLSEAVSLCADEPDAVLKIIVTRGVGERGYAPPTQTEVTRVLSLSPMPNFPQAHVSEGVRVRVCNTRLGSNPALAGIKHLNRLEQVLARAEWTGDEFAEGLMQDNNNKVIEGTMSNLFCVQVGENGPVLKTPRLDQCGVKGITRECIVEVAEAAGIPVQETRLELDDLLGSQELFLCNTLMGIWPVRQLQQQHFTVGPVTRQLSQGLEALHA